MAIVNGGFGWRAGDVRASCSVELEQQPHAACELLNRTDCGGARCANGK